jgi:NitT/TauT family transport system ATP-binding protein
MTIICNRVSRTFRTTAGHETVALADVSISISPREFVCLVGPSGCGKTTLLNLIAGFFPPTSGSILVNGKPVTKPGSDRGVVFQEYSLFGWLTVSENVEFGLRMAGVPAKERHSRASLYLRLVGLEGVDSKYPFELSARSFPSRRARRRPSYS